MIRATFIDFYNTLALLYPTREERQARTCRQFGLEADRVALRRACIVAEGFWTQANAVRPINQRSAEERAAFVAEYEQRLLAMAGLEVDREMAAQIYVAYRREPFTCRLHDDALAALASLREHGLRVGVISNADDSIAPLCAELGLDPYVDFVLSSCEVGVEKPDPRIFRRALELAGVEAGEAIHVGDQYHSDVVGARAAGIRPLLLDRYALHAGLDGVERISSLVDVTAVVVGGHSSGGKG